MSNSKDASIVLKHDFEIVSTDEGIQIASSDEQWQNALSPRIESFDPGSNVKSERLSQESKQDGEIVLTDEGMQIDSSDKQR
jgi:hypothetical protein